MHLELVSIPTPGEPVDGLLYLPDVQVKAAALIFHGNCNNFYSGPSRFLPDVLVPRGIACLAFNRRGHDMVTSLIGRSATGGSFQLAAEGIADNRCAADWLAARGFMNPIIIGHSNGGMLAAQHCAENYGNPRALVLMSAHGGGRDMAKHSNAGGIFAQGPAGGAGSASESDGGRRPRPRIDADTRLVVGDQRRELPGPYVQHAGYSAGRVENPLPIALYSRRKGSTGGLSRRSLRRQCRFTL